MFKGLEGRSAIVTGGSTLIGAGVVRAMHAAGVKVVIADIDAGNGQALAASLGTGVRFVRTDITDDAQVQACVAEAAERHGGVHFLVNLACSYLDDGFKSPPAATMCGCTACSMATALATFTLNDASQSARGDLKPSSR